MLVLVFSVEIYRGQNHLCTGRAEKCGVHERFCNGRPEKHLTLGLLLEPTCPQGAKDCVFVRKKDLAS